MRTDCYSKIEEARGIPLLVYATKFPLPSFQWVSVPNSIDIDDVDWFTDLVNSISDSHNEVDVLIHSPWGKPDATERIVGVLRNRFDKVNFLVPHSAYSAATMLALSWDNIILHPSAILWPIDPQINWVPARSIKRWFDKIKQKITEEGPESMPAYIPLIEKYSIELLELCEDSEKLSKVLVSDWLSKYMFAWKEESESKLIIDTAVDFFSDYDRHLLHSRPFSFDKLQGFGLNIYLADESLQSLLREAYILLNWFFSVTDFVKLFETRHGVSRWRLFKVSVERNPS